MKYFLTLGTFSNPSPSILKLTTMDSTTITKKLNTEELEQKVKNMYRDVALHPEGKYHFEMGRNLAEKLGYEKEDLDAIPAEAIDSFAGVGYFINIANFNEGEKVLDLGSGSGMDSFIAALKVGKSGYVTGIDMTDEQLHKANNLAKTHQFHNVQFIKGYLEQLPFENASFDVVISNGVINLCPDKEKVFAEIARVLKSKSRMVIADIVSKDQLPDNIVCDATLWASCIGGAGQEDVYKNSIEDAGMEVLYTAKNTRYEFVSKSARHAAEEFGVKSVSLFAEKREAIKSNQKLKAHGLACLNLTPEISKSMKNIAPSQILEVFSDDPASRVGVPAWVRLTGHTLLVTEEVNENDTIFYIQKKSS